MPVCGRKFCGRCGRWRPVNDFRPFRADGVIRLRSCCEACRRIVEREQYPHRTPVQLESRRESWRFYKDKVRREQGIPARQFRNRQSVVDRVEGTRLSVDPLLREMRWYVASHQMTWADLSEASGVPERTLGRLYRGESSYARIDVVDRLATAMGIPLATMYPFEEAA